MINLENYTASLKTSWVRRYTVDKLDDHWADLVDNFMGINMEGKDTLLGYRPEKFQKIIQAELPGISSIFKAYKKLKSLFPSDPESMNNSSLVHNAFYSTNFTRKLLDYNKSVHLTPGFYGNNERHHTLKIEDLFPRGTFITRGDLENLAGANIIEMKYNNLKCHIKVKLVLQKISGHPSNEQTKKKDHTPQSKAF